MNRRVAEKSTTLDRLEDRGEEWHMDVLTLRRFYRVPLDRQGAHAFTRFYWSIMANQENSLRQRRQKKVLCKMLAKVLVPYIYRNRVSCLDESLWPISIRHFEILDHHLPTKFPKISASRQWQAIVQYYDNIRQELETDRVPVSRKQWKAWGSTNVWTWVLLRRCPNLPYMGVSIILASCRRPALYSILSYSSRVPSCS